MVPTYAVAWWNIASLSLNQNYTLVVTRRVLNNLRVHIGIQSTTVRHGGLKIVRWVSDEVAHILRKRVCSGNIQPCVAQSGWKVRVGLLVVSVCSPGLFHTPSIYLKLLCLFTN